MVSETDVFVIGRNIVIDKIKKKYFFKKRSTCNKNKNKNYEEMIRTKDVWPKYGNFLILGAEDSVLNGCTAK